MNTEDKIIGIVIIMVIVGSMLTLFNIPSLNTYLTTTSNSSVALLIGTVMPIGAILTGGYYIYNKFFK